MSVFFVFFIVPILVGCFVWLIYVKTRNIQENQLIQYYPNGSLKTITHYKGDVLQFKEIFDDKTEFKIVYRYDRPLAGEYHYCLDYNSNENNYFAYNPGFVYGFLKYNFREGVFPSSLIDLFSSYDKAKSIEVLAEDSAFYRFINVELKEDTSFILSAIKLNGHIITEIEDGNLDLFIAALSSKKPYLDSRIYNYFEEDINIDDGFNTVESNQLNNAILDYFFPKDGLIYFNERILDWHIPQEIKDEFIIRFINLNDDDFHRFSYSMGNYFNKPTRTLDDVDKADFIFRNKFILKRQFEFYGWKSSALRLYFDKNIELINHSKEYGFQKVERITSSNAFLSLGYIFYMVFSFISWLLIIYITFYLSNEQWMNNHSWVAIIAAIFSWFLGIVFRVVLENLMLTSSFPSKKKVLKKLQKQYTNKDEIIDILSGGNNTSYIVQYIDPLIFEDEYFQSELKRVNDNIGEFNQEPISSSDSDIYRMIKDIGLSKLTDDELIEIEYYYPVIIWRNRNPNSERIEKLTHDVEFMSKKVSEHWYLIETASQDLLDNEEFCLKAINGDAMAFEYVSDRLKDNEFVVRTAIEKDGFAIQFASNRMQNNKEIALLAVQHDIYTFDHLTESCKTDLEILELAFIQDKDFTLSCLSPDELSVILGKIKRNQDGSKYGFTYSEFSEHLGNIIFGYSKEDFFKKLHSGYFREHELEDLPSRYKNDKTVVLAAVEINGSLLEQASDHLKGDFDVVLAAVSQDGTAIAYASKDLWNNTEIINNAVRNNGNALEFVKCNDFKILKQAIISNPYCFRFIDFKDIDFGFWSESFQSRKLVKLALENEDFAFNLKYVPSYYQNKASIVKMALANYGSLEHASLRLRNNKRMVRYAIEQNPANFQFASIRLRRKKDLVKWCVEKDFNSFKFASFQLRSDLEFVKSLIQIDWRVIVHASIPILNNPEVVEYAFSKYKENDFQTIVSEINGF